MYEIGSNVNSNDYMVLRLYLFYEICLFFDDLLLLIIYKILNFWVYII